MQTATTSTRVDVKTRKGKQGTMYSICNEDCLRLLWKIPERIQVLVCSLPWGMMGYTMRNVEERPEAQSLLQSAGNSCGTH